MAVQLLEGKRVNLRIVEEEELGVFAEFLNDPTVGSEYMPILQQPKSAIKQRYERLSPDDKWFFVEEKNSNIIGWISHSVIGGHMTIEYALAQTARNRGCGTEAVMMMVDYLFLSRNIRRIQAEVLSVNVASQRVLEKAGFTREGIKRKSSFVKGLWQDDIVFSILREEWAKPKILAHLTL